MINQLKINKMRSINYKSLKKTSLVFLAIVLSMSCMAQEVKETNEFLELQEVIPFDGTIENQRDKVTLYLGARYQDGTQTENGLVYNGVYENVRVMFGAVNHAYHTVTVQFREGRAKVSIVVPKFGFISDGMETFVTWSQILQERERGRNSFYKKQEEETEERMRETLNSIKSILEENDDW